MIIKARDGAFGKGLDCWTVGPVPFGILGITCPAEKFVKSMAASLLKKSGARSILQKGPRGNKTSPCRHFCSILEVLRGLAKPVARVQDKLLVANVRYLIQFSQLIDQLHPGVGTESAAALTTSMWCLMQGWHLDNQDCDGHFLALQGASAAQIQAAACSMQTAAACDLPMQWFMSVDDYCHLWVADGYNYKTNCFINPRRIQIPKFHVYGLSMNAPHAGDAFPDDCPSEELVNGEYLRYFFVGGSMFGHVKTTAQGWFMPADQFERPGISSIKPC